MGKRSEELIIAERALAFQHKEKEKRAAELIISTAAATLERKKDEEYMGHLAAIVESSDDAIISKTLDGTIKSWNKGSEKMFGYTAKEAINKHISLIIPQEYIAEEKKIVERIRNDEIVEHYETIRNKKDGKQFNVSLTISPLKDRTGNIIGISKIARDITSSKKSEAELIRINKELIFQNEEKEKRAAELIIANKELVFQNEEKEKRATELTIAKQKVSEHAAQLESVNKELESFSYSISHDLRAPLRAVHGYTQILKEDYGSLLEPETDRLMNNIMKNATRMGQLIDDLLSFSRLGRKELVKMNIQMHELVINLCSELKNDHNEQNIQFKINKLKSAHGDNVAIKQVWVNLISNAIKYSRQKEKTIIEIGSEAARDEIVYHIKDNGAGFDMRYANKLFGVFQRLHTEKEFEGTGVGLAIVYRIISKHGGRVWAEGKVNEGAIFYFSLPKKPSL